MIKRPAFPPSGGKGTPPPLLPAIGIFLVLK
jgi:hypothetical protein